MFKWNKEKWLPISLKEEFRSLIVKYLVMLFSELTAWMKFSALEIADFAIWVNLFDLFSDDYLFKFSFVLSLRMGKTF